VDSGYENQMDREFTATRVEHLLWAMAAKIWSTIQGATPGPLPKARSFCEPLSTGFERSLWSLNRLFRVRPSVLADALFSTDPLALRHRPLYRATEIWNVREALLPVVSAIDSVTL
jgi:hypothetical protein